MMVVRLKVAMNASGFARRDLYTFIGAGQGALFVNKNQVYNLEYGLRERSTITLDCAVKWLAILGLELELVFQPLGSDALGQLVALRNAVAAGPEGPLRSMAEDIPVD